MIDFENLKLALRALVLSAVILPLVAAAQSGPTKEDSGWVSIFNGTDIVNGFYVYKSKYVDSKTQTSFTVVNGEIHAGGPYALLITNKEYSFYKVRVDYKFDAGQQGGNAGLMVLMDNEAAKTVTGVNRPRSIEVNCRRDGNYPWSIWGGLNFGPYMTTTIAPGTEGKNPTPYVPGGTALKTTDITSDPVRTIVSSTPDNEKTPGEWNHGEAWMYGDSGTFWLNGVLRTASWHWVVGKGAAAVRTASGGIGVQTEGYNIAYKNWEVMEIDSATHLPINARRGCMDKASPKYDPRAVIDVGCNGTTTMAHAGRFGIRAAASRLMPLNGSDWRNAPEARALFGASQGAATSLRAFSVEGRQVTLTLPKPAAGAYVLPVPAP